MNSHFSSMVILHLKMNLSSLPLTSPFPYKCLHNEIWSCIMAVLRLNFHTFWAHVGVLMKLYKGTMCVLPFSLQVVLIPSVVWIIQTMFWDVETSLTLWRKHFNYYTKFSVIKAKISILCEFFVFMNYFEKNYINETM